MIKFFNKFIREFDRKTNLKINNNIKSIYIFIIIFLKNISQQTNNDKFLRYNIIMNCKICFYFKKKRRNLNFDIINKKRYH